MSTFIQYRFPYITFKPSQWTRTLIWTLQVYTYNQWIHCNAFVHGVTHSSSRATHRLSLMTQVTEAYNNSFFIPINELSFTFSTSLKLQLEQTTHIMEAWLLQFHAEQKCHNQGTITKFLICCTHVDCPEKPPN
jgi:hypothetical protein